MLRKQQQIIDKWNDTISEKDASVKLNLSAKTLKRMRQSGKIKIYRHATETRRVLYSLTELTEIFCPQPPISEK